MRKTPVLQVHCSFTKDGKPLQDILEASFRAYVKNALAFSDKQIYNTVDKQPLISGGTQ